MESLLVSDVIPATRERLYDAWLSSQAHSAFTGDQARIDPVVGGEHSAFNGYATGKNLELLPYRRIVQSWRSTEFPQDAPDSRLEVTFEDTLGGTLVTILHSEIPPGHADQYRQGWIDYYLEAMKRHFAPSASNGVKKNSARKAAAAPPNAAGGKPAPRKAAARKPKPRKAAARKPAPRKAAARKPKPKARAQAKAKPVRKAGRKPPKARPSRRKTARKRR